MSFCSIRFANTKVKFRPSSIFWLQSNSEVFIGWESGFPKKHLKIVCQMLLSMSFREETKVLWFSYKADLYFLTVPFAQVLYFVSIYLHSSNHWPLSQTFQDSGKVQGTKAKSFPSRNGGHTGEGSLIINSSREHSFSNRRETFINKDYKIVPKIPAWVEEVGLIYQWWKMKKVWGWSG